MSMYHTIEKTLKDVSVPIILQQIELLGMDVEITKKSTQSVYDNVYGPQYKGDASLYQKDRDAKVLFPLNVFRTTNDYFGGYFEEVVCYSNSPLEAGEILQVMRPDDSQVVKFKVVKPESIGNTTTILTRFIIASVGDLDR